MTNEELDEAVLRAVRDGFGRFTSMSIRVTLARRGHPADYRAVDRSLQRLRRAGRIKYANGWKPAVQP